MQYLQAIDESIDKWKRIVAGETMSAKDCPLCNEAVECNVQEFFDFDGNCPIYNYTGEQQCYGTPFYKTAHYRACCGNYAYKQDYIQNNHMLSFLYELRLWYINQHTSRLAEFAKEGEAKK